MPKKVSTEMLKYNNQKLFSNLGGGVVSFTSGDSTDATEYTSVDTLSTGSTLSSLFNKVSTMFKNIRYLYSKVATMNSDVITINNNLLSIDYFVFVSPALTEAQYTGGIGNRLIQINISDHIAENTIAIIPLGCCSSTDSNKLGVLCPLQSGVIKSSLWRINGNAATTYNCYFARINYKET